MDEQTHTHYNGIVMSAMASQITSLMVVYSTVYLRRTSNKTSKLCITGLCEGNSAVTGEFPAQRASNAENISIWWRHYVSPDYVAVIIHSYIFPTADYHSLLSKGPMTDGIPNNTITDQVVGLRKPRFSPASICIQKELSLARDINTSLNS